MLGDSQSRMQSIERVRREKLLQIPTFPPSSKRSQSRREVSSSYISVLTSLISVELKSQESVQKLLVIPFPNRHPSIHSNRYFQCGS
jgi:hypothetical protein